MRHFIVKLVAPNLYERASLYYNSPREMTKFMGARFQDREIIGAEIGVSTGNNANTLLSFLNIRKYYGIDPYENYNQRMMSAKKQLKKFGDKVVFIRKFSSDAVNDIPDNLDFIYIDGNHDYEFIRDDIRLYYGKVKSGGVFGGHDFSPTYPGVIKAVNEFVKEKGLQLYGEENTNIKRGDWWVIKP